MVIPADRQDGQKLVTASLGGEVHEPHYLDISLSLLFSNLGLIWATKSGERINVARMILQTRGSQLSMEHEYLSARNKLVREIT